MQCSRALESAWGLQLLVAMPLAYICTCTYFALFRLNAFNYNKLIPGMSTGAALMQVGGLLRAWGFGLRFKWVHTTTAAALLDHDCCAA